ncbi:MAG: four helix bundle protein [Bacteroidota bacterium]
MPKVDRFEELGCWISARKLTTEIYKLNGEIKRDYGLRDQLRRASVSIMNNIAEGFGRFSFKEKVRYLEIAQSSANEVRSMFYLLDDLSYVTSEELLRLRKLLEECQKQIWGFIRYLRSRTPK